MTRRAANFKVSYLSLLTPFRGQIIVMALMYGKEKDAEHELSAFSDTN